MDNHMGMINTAVDVATLILNLRAQTTTKALFRLTLRQEDASKLLLGIYQNNVETRHKVFTADAVTREIVDQVTSFMTKDGGKFGIMLSGLPGNGKTTMLVSIAQLIEIGIPVGFVLNTTSTLGIYDAEDVLKISRNEDTWRDFKAQPMLAIDDFGKESTDISTYGNVSSPMIELLEYRYRKMLYTVLSTNLNPKEVKEKYGARLADRFNEMLDVVVFKGRTYRR